MKGRLFWKLLIGSWVTLALVALGNAVLFHAVAGEVAPFGERVASRYAELALAAASEILKAQGPDALESFSGQLPTDVHVEIARSGYKTAPATPFQVSRSKSVTTAGGSFLVVATGSLSPTMASPLVRQVPLHLLLTDFVALTLFGIIIAKYLAGPIQRLSSGLARVAEGDLDVRVSEHLGGRKDEMADLAHSFDHMAHRLQQLHQARERLLHDLSHEFRSPLTRIRLAAEFAVNNPDRWRTSIDRIFGDVERLSGMVETLLTMSRAQFATTKSETYFDLADLLDDLMSDMRFEADAAHVKIDVLIPDQARDRSELVLNGSADLLRKAIENVLRNAVRFSKSGQTVTLTMSASGDHPSSLQIEISDQGPGVPQESLQRIFEPFERLDQFSTGDGYGLGLAIARTAVQAHQGVIWAANRPMGGLTVTIRLPVAQTASALTHTLRDSH